MEYFKWSSVFNCLMTGYHRGSPRRISLISTMLQQRHKKNVTIVKAPMGLKIHVMEWKKAVQLAGECICLCKNGLT